MNQLTDFIDQLSIVDVHEHHVPEIFLNKNVGLLDLLNQSYAGWTQARPYPLPSETRSEDPMLAESGDPTWDQIAAFVERSGSSSFVRNLVNGLDEIYDLGGDGITQENWQHLDQEIRSRHASGDWPHALMRQSGVERIITDAYTNPLLDVQSALGPNYQSVMRINALAMSYHPDRRDHNDNSLFEFAEALNQKCDSFDDFCGFLVRIVETLADRNQVALKNALAYDRDIMFLPPREPLARKAWRNADSTREEQKAFGDFVVDRLCSKAGEMDVPVQMHVGTAILRGSHPMGVAGLIERHPKTRFLLMHLAYPWSSDLLAMAFVYRNIWLDLTWSFLLSPTHFKRAFHEAIELLPNESRMMFGGDNWHAEESFSTFRLARRLIREVLEEKIDRGYFKENDAKRLAEKIFSQNAKAFFDLKTPRLIADH